MRENPHAGTRLWRRLREAFGRSTSGGTDATAGDPEEPIAYFLKFPSDEATRAAVGDLEGLGFAVNPQYTAAFGGDDEGWLVVERHDAVSDLAKVEGVLSKVAEQHGGVYDGWEAPIS